MQKGDAMDAAERSERIPDIVIITGMSGSGRTQAMHVFEDMGYFCIDNLPPRLIAQLAELVGINTGVGRHLAVTCDLRSQGLFDELLDAVAALEEREMSCDIVFLEASDEVLIRRYSENRRRHPIAKLPLSIAPWPTVPICRSCARRPRSFPAFPSSARAACIRPRRPVPRLMQAPGPLS